MLQDIILGVKYFCRGFMWLKNPKIRHFVLIPLIINILLFIGMMLFAKHYFNVFVVWIDGFLPSWLYFLNWLLWLIFASAIYLVIVYMFVIFANIIGSPFNSFLAEKVEALISEEPAFADAGLADFVKDIPRTIKRELRKLVYYLPLVCLFLILFFVPVIHIFAGILWFLFSAWMLAIQYLDYPFDNHKVPFIIMKKTLAKRKLLALSFGGMSLLVSLIPIVNFVVMPASVIGATLMWVEEGLS